VEEDRVAQPKPTLPTTMPWVEVDLFSNCELAFLLKMVGTYPTSGAFAFDMFEEIDMICCVRLRAVVKMWTQGTNLYSSEEASKRAKR
jgi:hypothetical protein